MHESVMSPARSLSMWCTSTCHVGDCTTLCQMDEKSWSSINVPPAPHLETVVLGLYQQIDTEPICSRVYQHWLQDNKIEIHYQIWIWNRGKDFLSMNHVVYFQWSEMFRPQRVFFSCKIQKCISFELICFCILQVKKALLGANVLLHWTLYHMTYTQFKVLSPVPCLQDVSAL